VKVLVTGANGFLGRRVLAALLRRGHAVRALVRPSARIEGLGWPPEVEVVRADLRGGRLDSAFAGVDALVHLAAALTGSEDAQFAATVVGTERLLEAMARSDTRRLVLASSFSVYDWSEIRGTLDEESPLEQGAHLYARDGYPIAKVWQERITRRRAEEHGWELTVLRPGWIWGRGQGYLAGLGQRLGRVHLVFGPATRLPLTHVDNCADLFAHCLEAPGAVGGTFNVVDSDDIRIWRYLGDHLRRSGERGFRVPIPYRVVYTAVRMAFGVGKRIWGPKVKLPGLLIPWRFEARFKPLRFPNRKARQELGWSPPLAYLACLDQTYGPEARPGEHQRAEGNAEDRASHAAGERASASSRTALP
jgi:nucleoside-diphosphate-sugar epimerase